jgi:hypothetical protein
MAVPVSSVPLRSVPDLGIIERAQAIVPAFAHTGAT